MSGFHPTPQARRRRTSTTVALAGLCLLMGLAPTPPARAGDVPQMDETVVSASRVPVSSQEIGSAVTVISAEQLQRSQVRQVSDVLRDVPGLAVNRTGPLGGLTQIRLRGAEGNHTLVVMDGIELNNPASSSEYNFADLLDSGIDRIEVLRGPQSALYGSDAIGGVVNIITRRPDAGVNLRMQGELGSFVSRYGMLNLGYGADRYYLSGTVQRQTTNGVSAADEANGNAEKDGYGNTTLRLKGGATLTPALSLELVGMRVDSNKEGDAFATLVNTVDGDSTSTTLQRVGLVTTRYTPMGDRWAHTLHASYARTESDFFDGTGARTFASRGLKTKYAYQTDIRFDTDVASAQHTVTLAAEKERDSQLTDSAFSGVSTRSVTATSYVAEYRAGLWQRLFLSASARRDNNDTLFDDETTYRGTLAYLNEGTATRLHGSVGRGVKNPTLRELFGSTPTFVGNPNLTAEESIGWDAGVEQPLAGDTVIADVTWFQNRITDLIRGSGNTAVNQPGTSFLRGLELTLKAHPAPALRLALAYTFTRAEDAQGVDLVRRARHIGSISADYDFQAAGRPGSVRLDIRYNGSQRDTVFDAGFNQLPVRLGSYTLVNLASQWQMAEQLSLFARVENLLDKEYQEVFGYGTPGIGGYAGLRWQAK